MSRVSRSSWSPCALPPSFPVARGVRSPAVPEEEQVRTPGVRNGDREEVDQPGERKEGDQDEGVDQVEFHDRRQRRDVGCLGAKAYKGPEPGNRRVQVPGRAPPVFPCDGDPGSHLQEQDQEKDPVHGRRDRQEARAKQSPRQKQGAAEQREQPQGKPRRLDEEQERRRADQEAPCSGEKGGQDVGEKDDQDPVMPGDGSPEQPPVLEELGGVAGVGETGGEGPGGGPAAGREGHPRTGSRNRRTFRSSSKGPERDRLPSGSSPPRRRPGPRGNGA